MPRFKRDDEPKYTTAQIDEFIARDWLSGAPRAHGNARYYGWIGRVSDLTVPAVQVKGMILRYISAVAENLLDARELEAKLGVLGWKQLPEARINWDAAWDKILADVAKNGPTDRKSICDRTGLPWVVCLTTIRALIEAGHTVVQNWRGEKPNEFVGAAKRAASLARKAQGAGK